MSTANHSVSKYRNQAQKLEEKQSCGAHQTDNGRVGWDHQIHTSRLPRMIRNHMYTCLYQAPCQLCLTTSLLATDDISHEGPRFFTLVQPWRTSISHVLLITVRSNTEKRAAKECPDFIFVLRKKGSKTKERMKEEEIEKGDCGPPTRKVFFLVLSDLNQAVPNHLADESQTR